MLGAVINGYKDNAYPGLLTPQVGGLVYSLVVTLPRAIATALGATPPTVAAKKAAPSAAEAVATEETGTDGTAGTGRLKLAVTPADDTPVVKDGNKFEPSPVSGSGAADKRSAAASSAGGASSSDAKGSSTGGTGKGRSARHAAGGDS